MPTFFSRLLLCAALMTATAFADETTLDTMDALTFRAAKEKATVQPIDGRTGGALSFHFEDTCKNAFIAKSLRPTEAWDRAEGFSFWVKGDGSAHLGALQFIYNENYAVRYDYAFPLHRTDWQKITVRWSDLIPVLPGAKSIPLHPAGTNKPSKLSALWFGKWWYWRDDAAHHYAIDDIRLEMKIDRPEPDHRPKTDPLSRVRDKLLKGRPITVVTMGDSLTDFKHWANREMNWPGLLQEKAKQQHKSVITIHNPAIGGTQLRQNLVMMPQWVTQVPAPDLITVCFGYNDWSSNMRGPQFREVVADAIDRIRAATQGQSDILIFTTLPAVERWTTMHELADAARQAAKERHAGLADTEAAFLAAGANNPEKLFSRDKVHLGPEGHRLIADTVLKVIAHKP